MSKESELSISVSRQAIENSNGFSMDIGGSAVKLAYRHKDDWLELQKQGQDIQTATLRLKVFPRDKLEEALEFLSKSCHINREYDECPLVNITGMGGKQLRNVIENKLNVKTHIIFETECFFEAFVELARTLERNEFEYISTEERKEDLRSIMVRWWDFRAATNQDTDDERRAIRHLKATSWYMGPNVTAENMNLPITETVPQMYPALLYLVSSASGFFKVISENTYEIFAANFNGGMIFLGLGTAICRAKKSFDDLIDMAEKGNFSAVDETFGCYESPKDEQERHYSAMTNTLLAEDETLYAFRKIITDPSASYKEEDLILSLLKTIVRYIVQIAVTTAESTGMQHVYLVGSFFNRQLVRKLFEEEFCRQIVFASKWNDEKGMDIEIHFVKTGGYLGSIGAFLNSTKSHQGN